jgi:hypothetical protein
MSLNSDSSSGAISNVIIMQKGAAPALVSWFAMEVITLWDAAEIAFIQRIETRHDFRRQRPPLLCFKRLVDVM